METPFTNEAQLPEEQTSVELRPRNHEEQDLVCVVEEIVDYYIENYYPSRFDIIKAKYLFNGDEKMAVSSSFHKDANLTCHRHGLIDGAHDAFTKEVLNQNYTPKMIPLHPCDNKYTDDAQDAYDWMYHRSRFETEVSEQAYSEAVLIGDSYVFFGKEKYGKYEVPTSEHISFFEMFLEPMATSFESSRYKIVRKVMDSVDIIKKYEWLTDWDKETIIEGMPNSEAILETIDAALYDSDFSKIWDINTWECKYLDACENYCNGVDGVDREQKFHEWHSTGKCYEDLFGLSDESTLCETIEFWEKTKDGYEVKIMVNGYLLPVDDKIVLENDPFGNVYYEEAIGSPVHRGLGHKIMPRQREADMLLFIIDNGIKMHAFPDWISDGGLIDADGAIVKNLFWSSKGTVMRPKKTNMQGKQPFKPVDYMPKDILNIARVRLSEVEQSAHRDAGINSYILGSDGRVERVRAAFDERVDQSRSRLKTVKKSISKALNKSYYVWLNILDGKFGKKLLERLDSKNDVVLKDLNIKDIINNFEVLISSEGQREDSLKDLGQNILNTVNGMGELLSDEFGVLFDRKKLACSLAESYGLDGLKFLTADERLKEKKGELKYGLSVAKLEQEISEEAAELQQGQQEQPQGLFDPRTGEPLDPALVESILGFLDSQGQQQAQPQQEILTDENGQPFQP